MSALPVRAYVDRVSYEAGDTLSLHVDAGGDTVSVTMVEMVDSLERENSRDRPVVWAAAGDYPTAPQAHRVGSFATGATGSLGRESHRSVTLGAMVWSPRYHQDEDQVLVSLGTDSSGALSLELQDATLAMTCRDAHGEEVWAVHGGTPLTDHCWYSATGVYDDGMIVLTVRPHDALYGDPDTVELRHDGPVPEIDATHWTVAARNPSLVERTGNHWRGRGVDGFTGKIEKPFVAAGLASPGEIERLAAAESPRDVFAARLIAGYDFALQAADDPSAARPIADDQTEGKVVNLPSRGVTGSSFTGDSLDYRSAPAEYAAIHFHATDVVDIGWDATLTAELPAGLDSGVYGVVVSSPSGSDTVPIVVVPARGSAPRNRVAVVLPTFSYLAYANENLFNGLDSEAMTPAEVFVDPVDEAHVNDASFGLSMYDTHRDGSGVMYSSIRRSIVNFRRGYRMWLNDGGRGFSAEMYLIEWLDRRGIDFDVITDLEVHERGADYLDRYSVLISGSHPEYTSAKMLDALTEYRDNGGSLMYLGGNGWYWVTGVVDTDPLVVEIRRGMAGIRCWESYPGEVTLVSTGEPGGLWRHRGRAPQKLTGVGMAAQGWGRSEPYFRSEHAADPDLQWIFDGVEQDPIGAYGLSMNGAAGDEIDRFDHALGTPPHAAVVASSRGHSNYYQRALEEIAMNLPGHGGGEQDPEVRADIVYFSTPRGGEVFSVGSIAWSGALLHNDTENGVSRMTENVIRTFVARRS